MISRKLHVFSEKFNKVQIIKILILSTKGVQPNLLLFKILRNDSIIKKQKCVLITTIKFNVIETGALY